MDGHALYPGAGQFRPGIIFGTGSFQANGGSSPSTTTFGGSLKNVFTVTYSATGIFTVTLAAGLVFPETPIIEPSNSCADITDTNRFYVVQTGTYNATNRTFVLQAVQDKTGTAFAPPNTAGNRIQFSIEMLNNTGK